MKRKIALVAGVAVLALAASGCSDTEVVKINENQWSVRDGWDNDSSAQNAAEEATCLVEGREVARIDRIQGDGDDLLVTCR